MSADEVITDVAAVNKLLAQFRPRKKWYRRFCKRSAVALLLRQGEGGVEVLMIKRAERKGDPWSGHMAFPGGRMDDDDDHSLAAARRETLEEIGLDTQQHAHFVARLSDINARPHRGRRPMVVTPFVFHLRQLPTLVPNHEVAEVVWVPLAFLAERGNRGQMQWQLRGLNLNLPCYDYGPYRIWGLSLMMLDELLRELLPS